MSNRARAKLPATRSSPLRWLVMAVIVVAVVGGVLYATRDNPQRLLVEGRALLPHDPLAAETLFERSAAAAGGDFPEAQLMQCRALAAMGRWPAALGGFSLIRQPEACPQEDLWLMGQAAFQQREFHLADLRLRAARRDGPHKADVLRLLLPRHIETERYDEALRDARELAEMQPDDPFPWRMQAVARARTRDTLGAIADYREALRRNPSPPELRAIRLELLDQLIEAGDIQGSRQELEALLKEPKPTADLLLKSAHVLRLEGRATEAIAEIDRALSIRRRFSNALFLRGTLHMDEGRMEPAAADLRTVVELEPFNGDAHYKLAQACRNLGKSDEAAEHQRIARELSDARREIALLRQRLAIDPTSRELRKRLAALLERTGDTEEAGKMRNAIGD